MDTPPEVVRVRDHGPHWLLALGCVVLSFAAAVVIGSIGAPGQAGTGSLADRHLSGGSAAAIADAPAAGPPGTPLTVPGTVDLRRSSQAGFTPIVNGTTGFVTGTSHLPATACLTARCRRSLS
jgi:hypothetical protein